MDSNESRYTEHRNLKNQEKNVDNNQVSLSVKWYGNSLRYWNRVKPTNSGMLGGREDVHNMDVIDSRCFLQETKAVLRETVEKSTVCTRQMERGIAIDCGCGIGRLTEVLLLSQYHIIDLVEPCEQFLRKAKKSVPSERIGNCYPVSLQNVKLERGRYNCVLVHWVSLLLTDQDFVTFFMQCRKALCDSELHQNDISNDVENSFESSAVHTGQPFIFVKDNVAMGEDDDVDMDESTIVRTHEHFLKLFSKAGLSVVYQRLQSPWPRELYPAWMFALRSSG